MPKSQPPREKKSDKSRLQVKEVIQRAAALDRRRQAQITNQGQAITRLLEAMNNHTPFQKAVTDELAVLHQGTAVLTAERDEAREALKALTDAIDALHLDQLTVAGRDTDTRPYHDALSVARTLVGAQAG